MLLQLSFRYFTLDLDKQKRVEYHISSRKEVIHTETTLKPGTRCECRDYKCDADSHGKDRGHAENEETCQRDAVRMVTVRESNPYGANYGEQHHYDMKQVPMCAPCAEYAEAKITR